MFTERDSGRIHRTRTRQAWPPGQPFKILSLDGGGIRGIFSANVIAQIENVLDLKEPAGAYFDLICGTSTGGIIAIALGLGVPIQRIVDLYQDSGKDIFPPLKSKNRLFRFTRQLRAPLHDHRVLEAALRKEFGSLSFGSSGARLVIPAVIGPNVQVTVFKTDHHPDFKNDWKTPAWEVARATSAAPTFFQGYRFNLDYALDGGLWANNPTLCGIAEAVGSYGTALEDIRVLSIGTGNPQPKLSQAKARAGLIGWRDVITTTMYLSTDSITSQARLLLGYQALSRIEPSADAALIEMDDWQKASRVLPGEAVRQLGNQLEAVRSFFDELAEPRERYYSTAANVTEIRQR